MMKSVVLHKQKVLCSGSLIITAPAWVHFLDTLIALDSRSSIVTCSSDYWTGFRIGWLELLTPCTHDTELQVITALSLISTIYSSPQRPLSPFQLAVSSLVLSWQRIYNNLTITRAHMKSSVHGLIPFFSIIFDCHLKILPQLSANCSLGTPERDWLCSAELFFIASCKVQIENTTLLLFREFISAEKCLPNCSIATAVHVTYHIVTILVLLRVGIT
jgi:hypothetical protein